MDRRENRALSASCFTANAIEALIRVWLSNLLRAWSETIGAPNVINASNALALKQSSAQNDSCRDASKLPCNSFVYISKLTHIATSGLHEASNVLRVVGVAGIGWHCVGCGMSGVASGV